MKAKRPSIAITMGDPAGIGPEIILKALARRKNRRADFLIIGDGFVLKKAAMQCGLEKVLSRLEVVDLKNIDKKSFVLGKTDTGCGRASVEYIKKAVDLIKSGLAAGLVTAPINKEAAHSAGFKWLGHTEYLAHLTGAKKFCMVLCGGPLRVALATRHIALSDVAEHLDTQSVYDAIVLTAEGLRKYFRIKNPKIAVAGLNPHSGEEGLFGDEEKRIIIPAINAARKKIPKITGPLPADSLFYDAYRGKYDAEIVMYHDQGLIPLKMVAKDTGVNITFGLPFVRTSPAHGTAFDIAGKNKANPSSMIEAIKMALDLS